MAECTRSCNLYLELMGTSKNQCIATNDKFMKNNEKVYFVSIPTTGTVDYVFEHLH